jgi:hypothetical protein
MSRQQARNCASVQGPLVAVGTLKPTSLLWPQDSGRTCSFCANCAWRLIRRWNVRPFWHRSSTQTYTVAARCPHGARELAQPEPGFYFAGMKAYGRAPTFLMMTGYEQVRSIVADIAGDREAAERVELVLPETGVCSRPLTIASESAVCCGGPAPPDADGCCKQDADAKAAGAKGCGCS